MRSILCVLLVLALLAPVIPALAEGSSASALPSPAPDDGVQKPDVGLYIIISLFPVSAVVVGVLWVIRFKEKHIDGK
ncbi:MAG TPA: hypothetical protein VN540_07325 [Clostridia bacterium]|nr:hypothetical protein [Clostridia bacterium]